MNVTTMSTTIEVDSDVVASPLFLAYDIDPDFRLSISLAAYVYALLATVGIIFNTCVCIVTVKYRKYYSTLRSNTSILLAVESLLEIMHQSGHIIFFIKFIFFGTKFIKAKTTAFLMFVPTLGVGGAVCTLFSLSADRLLAIAIPIK
uniref:G_PROTEIN_RECEP_F1_2 domain-containing protein n=1 Tax=Meloidogyne hapla TaxID=6305 RepID=A0A1I8BU23_MELHA